MLSSVPNQSSTWDSPRVHRELAALTIRRGQFRIIRLLQRLRSPRRLIATTLALVFFAIYIANGVFVLSARTPTDPARLQLWLSGGMVIYLLYHLVRCCWTSKVADLEMSRAEELWLGGGPVRRSSLALYHVNNIVVAAVMKTFLLAVVLACDVSHFSLLLIGVFSSLVVLEISRLVVQRGTAGLSKNSRNRLRWGVTAIAGAVALQVIARVLAGTPIGSPTWKYLISGFSAIGDVAASDTIQWLALPWISSARLAVTADMQLMTFAQLAVSLLMIPVSIAALVRVDAWSQAARHRREQERLQDRSFLANSDIRNQSTDQSFVLSDRVIRFANRFGSTVVRDALHLVARQSVSVNRYRGTIIFSFIVPTLLCLSPLATGQITEQWFYVVGGIAMCTMLLAPPALRIDFRRDLRRMQLLRSLPVRPLSMVLGQLALPLLITLAFQWITIVIAALVTQPGWFQCVLWTGMLSALAVFTFAAENALFLAYPHHERAEGIGMMIRAKLTFLGKAAVIAGSLGALVAWAVICKNIVSPSFNQIAFVTGAVLTTWMIAIASVATAAWCWRRFDLSYDIPPE
ncbi:hypothetical protein K239x_53110 [Planctomycetes bacterium K23_9]|uniref:Uncharacterized protein n=2 Tax=Stieleria marina TaxID=1930275 RepID=A0A517P1R6_9BACT|nr:hypothetical protein K239x_53110 [Planctomycetes bacterium K23_9]